MCAAWDMVCMLNWQGTQTTRACLSLVHGLHVRAAGHTLRLARRPCQMLGMFQPSGTQTTRACTNLCVFSLDFHSSTLCYVVLCRQQTTLIKHQRQPRTWLRIPDFTFLPIFIYWQWKEKVQALSDTPINMLLPLKSSWECNYRDVHIHINLYRSHARKQRSMPPESLFFL